MSEEKSGEKVRTLSVIVPYYNAATTIGAQMEALARQRWDGWWEVICVDNGSIDDTLRIVEKYRDKLPHLRTMEASTVHTQYHAMNVGARAAKGEALLFCDADDEVGEGWLAAMAEALSTHDFVACRTESKKLNAPWLARGRGSSQGNGLHKLRFAPQLSYAGGGTMGIKRSLLLDVAGGFDDNMRHCGDTLLSIQLQLAGKEIHFVHDAVLHLRHRETFWGGFRQGFGYGEYQSILYKKSIALGVPKIPRPWELGMRGWHEFLAMLPRVRSKASFAGLAWRFGWQLGLLRGSIRHHVAYF